jgi:Spy/CpxP family protein refolding chaperone
MRIINKALLAGLALIATSPLLVAQGPPPEGAGPDDGPQRGREMDRRGSGEMRPRSAHHADFRGDGWMGPGMHRHGEFGLARLVANPEMRQRLGISSEQAAKIRQQELDFHKAQIRNRADHEVKRLELAALLEAEKPDRTQIDKKLREISDTQFAAEKSRIDQHLAMREALTPEQRDALKQMFNEFHRQPGERGFGHFGPGGPAGMGHRGPRGSRPPTEPQAPAAPQKPAAPNQPDN